MAASYTNLNDILSNFERIVVKGNHYTKTETRSQINNAVKDLQAGSAVLSALSALAAAGTVGVLQLKKDSSGAASSNIDVATEVATKEFVQQKINDLIGDAPATLDTLAEIAAALNKDKDFYKTIQNLIAAKADKNNPTFTGDITTPLSSGYVKANSSGVLYTENKKFLEQSALLNSLAAALDADGTGFVKKVTNDSSVGQPFKVIVDTTQYQTAINSSNKLSFSYIDNKPTTLAGYGITDALPVSTELVSLSEVLKTASKAGFLKVKLTGDSSSGYVRTCEVDNITDADLRAMITEK